MKETTRVAIEGVGWKVICFSLCMPLTYIFTGNWTTSFKLNLVLEGTTYVAYIIYHKALKKI